MTAAAVWKSFAATPITTTTTATATRISTSVWPQDFMPRRR
jgi:hypothetical protein